MGRSRIAGAWVVVALASAAPASADPTGISDSKVGIAIGAGALYVAETAAFAYTDSTDPSHSLGVGTLEAALNLPATALFVGLAIDSINDADYTVGSISACLGALNGWLAADGVHSMVDRWPHPVQSWQIAAGLLDTAQVLAFGTYDLLTDDRRDRWGLLQTAINLPVAGGLGYLAYREEHDGHHGPAAILGAGAAISGVLGIVGIEMAVRGGSAELGPPVAPATGAPGATPRSAMLMPMLVGDGRELGFGVGLSGRL